MRSSQSENIEDQAFAFDEVVGEYDRLGVAMDDFSWYRDHEILELINNSVPATCKSGLDIGCGTGIVLGYLAEKNDEVHWLGIDKAPEMIARASAKCGRFRNVSLQRLEWGLLKREAAPKGFDFILLKNVLHLVADVSQQLSILPGLLSPSGRILVVETVSPNADSKRFISKLVRILEIIGVKKHVFAANEVIKSVKRAGLDIQRVQYHDQYIEIEKWINAKARSANVGNNAMSYIKQEMLSGNLPTSMKYQPPSGSFPGKMLRRQILIQCVSKKPRDPSRVNQ